MDVAKTEVEQRYFDVSIKKYLAMSICTFGIYDIYWGYKNWSYIKARDKSDIKPFWRGLFLSISYYWLLKDLGDKGQVPYLRTVLSKVFLALAYLSIGVLAQLPDPYWMSSFLGFVFICPAVHGISQVNKQCRVNAQRDSANTIKNYLTYVIGGSFVLLVWGYSVGSFTGYFPSVEVVEGKRLHARNIQYLIDNDLLDENDEIIYFYSTEILSIDKEGQFLTDEYVVSYEFSDENDDFLGGKVYLENIADVSVEWSKSILDNTIVTITDNDGFSFDLWLSSENGGDKKFVKELKRLRGIAQIR